MSDAERVALVVGWKARLAEAELEKFDAGGRCPMHQTRPHVQGFGIRARVKGGARDNFEFSIPFPMSGPRSAPPIVAKAPYFQSAYFSQRRPALRKQRSWRKPPGWRPQRNGSL